MGSMRIIVLVVLVTLGIICVPKLSELFSHMVEGNSPRPVESIVESVEGQGKIVMSPGEWKRVLSPELYNVARREGTEAPFSGKYNEHFADGIYYCFVCGSELFDSKSKFATKSGWPAFDTPTNSSSITVSDDRQDGVVRSKIKCTKCESHLGYLYIDGPKDRTGLRYSVNSISLRFVSRY